MREEDRRPWWLLLAATGLVIGVTFLLRPAMSYRALELDVPAAWFGLLSTSFAFLPLLVFVLPGRLVDRRGERPALLGGAALVLASTFGCAVAAESVLELIAWSAVLGLGHVFCMVGGQSMAVRLAPEGRQEAVLAQYAFASSVGQVIGPALIAIVSRHAAAPSTTTLFVVAIGMAAALVGVSASLPAHRPAPHRSESAAGVSVLLRNRTVWRAIVTGVMTLTTVDLIVVYLPVLGQEYGMSASFVGILLTLRAVGSMISRLAVGPLVDQFARSTLIIASFALSGVAIAVLALDGPAWVLGFAAILAGAGLGVAQPLNLAWTVQSVPPDYRGRVIALRLMGNRVALLVLPPTMGSLAGAWGARGVLWTCALTLGGSAVATRGAFTTGRASGERDA